MNEIVSGFVQNFIHSTDTPLTNLMAVPLPPHLEVPTAVFSEVPMGAFQEITNLPKVDPSPARVREDLQRTNPQCDESSVVVRPSVLVAGKLACVVRHVERSQKRSLSTGRVRTTVEVAPAGQQRLEDGTINVAVANTGRYDELWCQLSPEVGHLIHSSSARCEHYEVVELAIYHPGIEVEGIRKAKWSSLAAVQEACACERHNRCREYVSHAGHRLHRRMDVGTRGIKHQDGRIVFSLERIDEAVE
ncbi:MAG: hypothetical protein F4Z65_13065 [Acidobacteria bacterium]|nr:hypothetical protein [Acidobacteriota bacterium]